MRKLLSLVLASIMLLGVASALTSCGNSDDISVKISFMAGDEVVFRGVVAVNGENATVLKAVQEAMAQKNWNIVLDGFDVKSVNEYVSCKKNYEDRDLTFGWLPKLNGEELSEFADAVAIKDQDEIIYYFTYSYVNDAGKTETQNYDSEMGLFGDAADEDAE